MKKLLKILKGIGAVAAGIASIMLLFGGCTDSKDTLGKNLKRPESAAAVIEVTEACQLTEEQLDWCMDYLSAIENTTEGKPDNPYTGNISFLRFTYNDRTVDYWCAGPYIFSSTQYNNRDESETKGYLIEEGNENYLSWLSSKIYKFIEENDPSFWENYE